MLLFHLLWTLLMTVAIGEHSEPYDDHLKLDASLPTPQSQFQANSRVTNDFMENLLGHRSGIGATGLGNPPAGQQANGVQLAATAYLYTGMTAVPRPRDTWYGQARERYNVENF
jgi:hypothetical protein